MFANDVHFHPSKILVYNVRRLSLEWSPICFNLIIGLGWKLVVVANTLAHYDIAAITAIKSFIVQDP